MSIIGQYINRYSLATLSGLFSILTQEKYASDTGTEYYPVDTSRNTTSLGEGINDLNQTSRSPEQLIRYSELTIRITDLLIYGGLGYLMGFIIEKIDKVASEISAYYFQAEEKLEEKEDGDTDLKRTTQEKVDYHYPDNTFSVFHLENESINNISTYY